MNATAIGRRVIAANGRSTSLVYSLKVTMVSSGSRFLLEDGELLALRGFGDDDLSCLKGLHDVRKVNLRAPRVTDAGLAYLKGLKNLSWVRLDQCAVTDAGLEHLAGLPLTALFLGHTNITDVGVGILASFGLEILSLEGTAISDGCVEHLGKMDRLQWLNLNGTKITGEGLMRLQPPKTLMTVYLKNTAIDDEWVVKLQTTCLANCAVWTS